MSQSKPQAVFENAKVPVNVKLAGLWASTMFCYIYNDYFQLLQPGFLGFILSHKTQSGQTAQLFLLAAAICVAIPSVMVTASLVLRPLINRWLNIIIGALYTIIIVVIAAAPGNWIFYILMSAVEAMLTVLIVWRAWTWPRHETEAQP